MTVAQLIDQLQQIEDKEAKILVDAKEVGYNDTYSVEAIVVYPVKNKEKSWWAGDYDEVYWQELESSAFVGYIIR